MTLNNRLAEKLRRRQLYLLRHQASFRAETNRYLDALGKAIAFSILTIAPNEPAREVYKRQRLDKLLVEVSALIAGTYKDISKASTGEMQGLAEVEALYLVKAVNDLVAADTVVLTMSAAASVTLVKDTLIAGAPMKDWWDNQSRRTRNRFAQEMRIGMLGGESDSELVKRVRGTRELAYRDGIMEVSRRMAKILVRGASSATTNAVRKKLVEDNPEVFAGIQQISVLDGRTSHVCIAYAGKCWHVPNYKPISHSLPYNGGVPRHPNCRSTEIPIIVDELGGKPADDVSFDTFIEGKSEKELNELLGAGRAQLYRDGKITLSDLVDQNGRALTLDQLREID